MSEDAQRLHKYLSAPVGPERQIAGRGVTRWGAARWNTAYAELQRCLPDQYGPDRKEPPRRLAEPETNLDAPQGWEPQDRNDLQPEA